MTNRSKLVLFALCLSVFLSVFSVLDLLEWLKNREDNMGHLSDHWSTYMLRVLFIASPIMLLMILRRSIVSAYMLLFTFLCGVGYIVYWSRLAPMPELGPDTFWQGVLSALIFLCPVGFSVYAIRTSVSKEGERSRWVEWRFVVVLALIMISMVPVACWLTPGEFRVLTRLYHKAAIERTEGDFDEVIRIYDSILLRAPDHYSAYCKRGLARVMKRDYHSAIRDLDRGLEMMPPRDDLMLKARSLVARGVCKQLNGRPNDALEDFTRTIELVWGDNISKPGGKGGWTDTKSHAYFLRGLIRFQEKDFSGAERDLFEALRMSKDGEQIKKIEKYLKRLNPENSSSSAE